MTFEVDSDEFGRFNKNSGSGKTTTLDKASLDYLAKMARDAQAGGNDLLNQSKLVKVERGEYSIAGGDAPGQEWKASASWEPKGVVTR